MPDDQVLPGHVGLIMDGNGRWAVKEGSEMPYQGYRQGALKAIEAIRWCSERHIKYLTLYALSTENMGRSQRFLTFLFGLFNITLKKNLDEFKKRGGRMIFSGDRNLLRDRNKWLVETMEKVEAETKNNSAIIVNVLIGYGGKTEILKAFRDIIDSGIKSEEVTEEVISEHMYNPIMPDLNLIIRTSGTQKLSNFCPWQSTYSLLYFCDVLWPDFSEEDLDDAIAWYKGQTQKKGL